MKGVKGASFGVRFYRRADGKTVARGREDQSAEIANNIEDIAALEHAMTTRQTEITTRMTDIPSQTDKIVLRDKPASVKATSPQKMQEAAMEELLWNAAKRGDCARIRMLVMDGVDLDARDAQGRTAINIATQYNQRDVLKTLLAAKEMRRMAVLGELPQTKFFNKFKKTGTDQA
jgi:hypothetical protein